MEVSGKLDNTSGISRDSDETFDFVCGPCSLDNSNLQAMGYCTDCDEYLCDACYKCHLRPRPSRHHVLLDAINMPKTTHVSNHNVASTERCPKHFQKYIEYFCPKHNYLGCHACIVLSHRLCDDVTYIPTAVDDLYTSDEYIEFKENLSNLEQDIAGINEKIKTNNVKIGTFQSQASNDVKNFRKNIETIFDELENRIEMKIKEFKAEDESKMKRVHESCQSLESEVTAFLKSIENKESLHQKYNLFVTMKQTKMEVELFEKKLKQIRNENEVKKYVFLQEKKILDMMTTMDELGRLVLEQTEDNDTKATEKNNLAATSSSHENMIESYENTSASTLTTHVLPVTMSESLVNITSSIVSSVDTTTPSVSSVDTTTSSVSSVNTTTSSVTFVDTTMSSFPSVDTTKSSVSSVNTTTSSVATVDTTTSPVLSVDTITSSVASVDTFTSPDSNIVLVANNRLLRVSVPVDGVKVRPISIILLGGSDVGKTVLFLRLKRNNEKIDTNLERINSTIGCALTVRTMVVDGRTITVQLYDTAGHCRYNDLNQMLCKEKNGAVLVYDVTNYSSYEIAKKWLTWLRKNLEPNLVITLVGNKSDLDHLRAISTAEAEAFADENKIFFAETFNRTSADMYTALQIMIKEKETSLNTSHSQKDPNKRKETYHKSYHETRIQLK